MGLPEYDKSLNVPYSDDVTVHNGQVVMEAISEDELDAFRRYCVENERAVFHDACNGPSRSSEYNAPQNHFDETESDELDVKDF
jgi:hypothetical protein